MSWTNLVAGLAVGALGLYLFTQARPLARAERDAFHQPAWSVALRGWSYRIGGIFLLVVAGGLVVGGAW